MCNDGDLEVTQTALSHILTFLPDETTTWSRLPLTYHRLYVHRSIEEGYRSCAMKQRLDRVPRQIASKHRVANAVANAIQRQSQSSFG